MAQKKKVIVVPSGNVKKLADLHGVTRAMVYNALSYHTNSEVAQIIRRQAIDLYGGVHTTKIYFD